MYDLSILIPARNEEWLVHTIQDILKNKRGRTEIIVGLEAYWPSPGIPQHPDVSVFYSPKPLGQRGMTNQLCKLSKAKWVMKCDAHVAFDEGFDVKLLEHTQDNWTIVPKMYNLHVFDWKCMKCGKRTYQGPTPTSCSDCDNTTNFKKKVVWKPRLNRLTHDWVFDKDLHFQYRPGPHAEPDSNGLVDTMSILGACFMLTREKYWELDICEEEFGSWGQQGTEVSCKTWLSGGRVVVNMNTWYSHLFRTQGGDFSFPYKQDNKQVEHARKYSKELFLEDKWPKAIHKLSWLIEKFNPPGWNK